MLANANQDMLDAFVIHQRPYQETSSIVHFFSQQKGRVSLIAKGLRAKKSQARKAILQPFNCISLSYAGRGELKVLTQCQLTHEASQLNKLTDDHLACGFYLNEIIYRALPEHEPFPQLFNDYEAALKQLNRQLPMPQILRNFETSLLANLGIAPDWKHDIDGNKINPNLDYWFIDEQGFIAVQNNLSSRSKQAVSEQSVRYESRPTYSGRVLLALNDKSLQQIDLKAAQQLTQRLLRQVIGLKPLQSRKLWQHSRN